MIDTVAIDGDSLPRSRPALHGIAMDAQATGRPEILRSRRSGGSISVSAIVNFHREGEIARRTLDGLVRVRQNAEHAGIAAEFIFVLDCADIDTTNIVVQHPIVQEQDLVLATHCRDLGLARNAGIAWARGEVVCNFDGDDFFSTNWIAAALHRLRSQGNLVVVHPRYIVSFGLIRSMCRVIDQTEDAFPEAALLKVHPWNAHVMAPAALFRAVPYRPSAAATGFGYEDWHWALEALAQGARHVTAQQTVLYYRRKANSMLSEYESQHMLIRPTRFFGEAGAAAGHNTGQWAALDGGGSAASRGWGEAPHGALGGAVHARHTNDLPPPRVRH